MGPGVEVLAAQLPGREQRLSETPLRHMEEAVPAALEALAPRLDRPFAFYGHSLGALFAYELTRALRDRGGPLPVHLFASGSRAPHMPLPEDPVHVLRGEAFLERLGNLGGTPPEVLAHRELMDLFTPMLLADFHLSETYRRPAADPLPVPLTALGGREDGEVRPERLEAWRDQTRETFDLRWYPGGHFFLHERRDEVLSAVRRALAPSLG